MIFGVKQHFWEKVPESFIQNGKTPEEAARKYAKKIWKNGRTYRSRIGYSAEDFLAGLAIVGAMAVDAEKEGRFIPAQEILKEIQKSKTDN